MEYYIFGVSLCRKTCNDIIFNNKHDNDPIEERKIYDDEKKDLTSFYFNTTKTFLCMIHLFKNVGNRSIIDKVKNIRLYMSNTPKILGKYFKNYMGVSNIYTRGRTPIEYMYMITPSLTHCKLRFVCKKENVDIKVSIEGGKRYMDHLYGGIHMLMRSYISPPIKDDIIDFDVKEYMELCNKRDVYEKDLNIIKFTRYIQNVVDEATKDNITTYTLSSNSLMINDRTFINSRPYGTSTFYEILNHNDRGMIAHKYKDVIYDYKDNKNTKVICYRYNMKIDDIEVDNVRMLVQ
jgi:hypothetical protein